MTTPAIHNYLLALADDEHFMGQQHTEWIGVAPFLEEDMAFASIGQDELGHAALLYALIVNDESAVDDLAFHRLPGEYRSCQLVEANLTGWADTLIRHWLYDQAEELRWSVLAGSSWTELANIAARAQREEAYHLRHAEALLESLLQTTKGSERLDAALKRVMPLTAGLFAAPQGEEEALAAGVASDSFANLFPQWQQKISERFPQVEWPEDTAQRTDRHPDFAALHNRIRSVLALDLTAVW
jgi:ring-1,2-phenylacetyl-CoA epoxidase subunit PaaC